MKCTILLFLVQITFFNVYGQTLNSDNIKSVATDTTQTMIVKDTIEELSASDYNKVSAIRRNLQTGSTLGTIGIILTPFYGGLINYTTGGITRFAAKNKIETLISKLKQDSLALNYKYKIYPSIEKLEKANYYLQRAKNGGKVNTIIQLCLAVPLGIAIANDEPQGILTKNFGQIAIIGTGMLISNYVFCIRNLRFTNRALEVIDEIRVKNNYN